MYFVKLLKAASLVSKPHQEGHIGILQQTGVMGLGLGGLHEAATDIVFLSFKPDSATC